MPHLYGVFLQNGFDELEIVKDIEQEHLLEMEVSPEDQRKLFDAILKLKMHEEKFSTILDRVSKSRNSSV